MLWNKNWRHCLKNIPENIREKPFTFQWRVSQWMKHLPPHIQQPQPLPSAWQRHIVPVQRCMPAMSSTGTAVCIAFWQRDAGCSVLLSLLESERRIGAEELLHMLGARFQRNQLQSHKSPFLSSPTTDSTGLLIANAVLICRTPFVWILGLDSHWHSHSQPHYLQIFRVHVHSPPQPGTWQGVLSSAPGPSQGVANWNTSPSCHQISKLSWNNRSTWQPGSLPGLFSWLCKETGWEAKLWDRSKQGHPCCFPSIPWEVKGLLTAFLHLFLSTVSLICLYAEGM